MRLWTMALLNLGRRPLRSTLTALGVAAAVAAFVALVGLSRGVERAWSGSLLAHGTHLLAVQKGAVELLTTSLDEALAGAIARVEGVESVAGELINVMVLEDRSTCVASGWSAGSHLWRSPRLVAGRLPSPGEPRRVLLGEAAAATLGKGPGDTVRIQDEPFTVSGLFRLESVMANHSAVLPLEAMQELMGRPGKVTGFHVRVRGAERPGAVAAVRTRLQEAFPRLAFHETATVADDNQIIRLFRAIAWSVSAIALAIALVVLLNTLLLAVLERTREIGVLSAMGWSARRIMGLLVLEGVFTAAAGGLAGLLLGMGGLRLLTHHPRLQGFIEPEVTGPLLAAVVLAAIALGVLGSAYPAWWAARLDPVEALRDE